MIKAAKLNCLPLLHEKAPLSGNETDATNAGATPIDEVIRSSNDAGCTESHIALSAHILVLKNLSTGQVPRQVSLEKAGRLLSEELKGQRNFEMLWDFKMNGCGGSSPVFHEGILYVGSGNGELHAINAGTGKPVWKSPTSQFISESPTVVDGMVFVGSAGFKFFAFDAESGEKIAEYNTSGTITNAPEVAGDMIFVENGDGRIYALRMPQSLKRKLQEITRSENRSQDSNDEIMEIDGWLILGNVKLKTNQSTDD